MSIHDVDSEDDITMRGALRTWKDSPTLICTCILSHGHLAERFQEPVGPMASNAQNAHTNCNESYESRKACKPARIRCSRVDALPRSWSKVAVSGRQNPRKQSEEKKVRLQ